MRFLAISVLLGVALAQTVPTPDNDPFYQPPSGFASSKPGTVLKSRPSKSGLLGVTATQILYRTNDANKKASATVATVLVGPKSRKDILVAYQDFEDACNTKCAPSYLFNTGKGNDIFGPLSDGSVSSGLANGWTIVVPDYEGINSSFAVGHLEGYAVLDAIRATLSFPAFGISANAALGGLGYSGGAIATSWAASLQPTYAPELSIKGWAFGGTPANTTSTLEKVDGSLFAGFGAGGAVGLSSAYPKLNDRVNQIITSDGRAAFEKIRSQCAIEDIFSFSFQTLRTTKYQSLGANLLYDPTIASYLNLNILAVNPSETPKAPIFMYHSTKDEVIPYDSAQKAAQSWCSQGATVNFTTEAGGSGHLGCELSVGPIAIAWLNDRVYGKAASSGCSFNTVSIGGLALREEEKANVLHIQSDVIDRLGVADEKVIADMTARYEDGKPIPKLLSYSNFNK